MKAPDVFLERAPAKGDLCLQDPWSEASAGLRHSLLVADGTAGLSPPTSSGIITTPITAALVYVVPASW
jgi:hypothetical protein